LSTKQLILNNDIIEHQQQLLPMYFMQQETLHCS